MQFSLVNLSSLLLWLRTYRLWTHWAQPSTLIDRTRKCIVLILFLHKFFRSCWCCCRRHRVEMNRNRKPETQKSFESRRHGVTQSESSVTSVSSKVAQNICRLRQSFWAQKVYFGWKAAFWGEHFEPKWTCEFISFLLPRTRLERKSNRRRRRRRRRHVGKS